MSIVASALVALVAFLHLGFLVLEMFFWNTEFGRRTFNLTADYAAQSAVLAANQGLYNGFLAAGLLWSLGAPRHLAFPLKVFFLGCVIVAGIFGGVTSKASIVVVQALPAVLAMAAVFAAQGRD